MKRLLTICTFLLLSSIAYAQNQQVFSLKGQVLDSLTQEPMAFASITVINQNKGIATNLEGEFEIPVILGDSIRVSSVGFAKYTFLVTSDMRESGFVKIVELSEKAFLLEDFEIFQLPEDFYLLRKKPDTLPPIRGAGWASMPLIGIPSKYVPESYPPFQLFSASIPLFQEISRNPKQDRILKKIQEAKAFKSQRLAEREKYFNKALVKKITRIDDRVIDEFMEFCAFLDGEIIGRTEYQISQKILRRYQAFLKR